MGRLARSRKIVNESWVVLKHDKEMLWFTVIATILCTLVSLVVFLFAKGADFSTKDITLNQVIGILIAYIAVFFITNFSHAAIMIIAHARFNGQDKTFNDGLNGAMANVGRIFLWSLISCTINYILDFISEKLELLGKIVTVIAGTAWEILTYFALPSIVIGGNSISGAFKESAAIIRKTWGETIIVGVGVGILFFTSCLTILIAAGLIIVFLPFDWVLWAVIALSILGFVVLSVVFSTLSVIFKLAIYEYARTGVVPQGFSQEIIAGAIQKKS